MSVRTTYNFMVGNVRCQTVMISPACVYVTQYPYVPGPMFGRFYKMKKYVSICWVVTGAFGCISL